MIKFFIKHPVTTIMFVLFWVVLGIVSFPKMNIESRPDIDLPMVTATFVYPGASPDEMESQIVKKSEDAISQVSGLKKITSQIFESGAMVMAEFNIGVNVNDKANEVKAKIDALANDFPSNMKAPVIEKLNVLQEPVVDIVLSGAGPRALAQFVDDVLSQQITALPGVASVNVFGGRERAVRIALNPDLMAARGIGVNDVVGTIVTSNLNIPGGKIESGPDSNIVRFVGEFAHVPDIAGLRITTAEGENFKLSDIATVRDSARDAETGARYNGADVVMVSVIKASDGNAIRISNEIRKNLPRLQTLMREYFKSSECRVQSSDNSKSDNSAQSADAATANCTLNSELSSAAMPRMEIVSDSSTAVLHETNDTIYGIVLGLALTVLTLYFFTRNWRTTVIAGVVIPVSFVSGFFFMQMSGFTINAMTLLAMATALGTLIMDAIVLIESALILIDQGHSPAEAAELGTKKVTVRIFATIATHVVVFLPLAFMGGIAGQFMKQFGLSVVYLVLLSSMFSFTLTPMMIAKILRKTKDEKRKTKPERRSRLSSFVSRLSSADKRSDGGELSWFRKFYDYQIAHPWRIV
ncbi:MAG: efflux RND transporter permease subunit, partial [Proteobacteria bacterium]|nr:efflux RND transporter permease subunit [Pseudomonadota bacterium]